MKNIADIKPVRNKYNLANIKIKKHNGAFLLLFLSVRGRYI